MNALILFYMGSHPDNRGRLLADILAKDDLWLEVTHDYIQWLFPNRVPSRVVPDAPVVTREVQAAFANDEILRQHLKASFHRMLAFYGLATAESGIVKAGNWEVRKPNWFVADTHNNLRITRILKSLTLLGLKNEATAFQAGLLRLVESEPDCGIGETARLYWVEALDVA